MIFMSCDSNTAGVSSGAETDNLSGHMISSQVYCGVRVAKSVVFCVVFYRSLFVLYVLLNLAIVSIYGFDIIKSILL